jgi:hypothetical protein
MYKLFSFGILHFFFAIERSLGPFFHQSWELLRVANFWVSEVRWMFLRLHTEGEYWDSILLSVFGSCSPKRSKLDWY